MPRLSQAVPVQREHWLRVKVVTSLQGWSGLAMLGRRWCQVSNLLPQNTSERTSHQAHGLQQPIAFLHT